MLVVEPRGARECGRTSRAARLGGLSTRVGTRAARAASRRAAKRASFARERMGEPQGPRP